MTASPDAVEIVQSVLGHGLFRVKQSKRTWSYKAEQEVELMVIAVGGCIVSAVVKLGDKKAEISFPDEKTQNATKQIKELVETALAEAKLMNKRMESFTSVFLDPPRYIQRVFIFETADGLDWGTTREEFGPIEPFMSVYVD